MKALQATAVTLNEGFPLIVNSLWLAGVPLIPEAIRAGPFAGVQPLGPSSMHVLDIILDGPCLQYPVTPAPCERKHSTSHVLDS